MVNARFIAFNSAMKMDAMGERDVFFTTDSDTTADPTPTSIFDQSVQINKSVYSSVTNFLK